MPTTALAHRSPRPRTARGRAISSGSARGSRSSGGSPSALVLFGLAAAGSVAYLAMRSKTAGAAELQPGTTPSGLPATPSKPTSELSEALKKQMAEALGRLGVSPATGKLSGAADADAIRFGSQVVGQLDSEGFHEAAAALRKYVDEAAKSVKTPADAAPIAAAAPAGLTQDQRDYIARVMALERDPNKLGLFIQWLKTLAPSKERDTMIQMAQALALQLAAAQSTASTMDKIDQIIKAPDAAAIQTAASQALPPLPAVPVTSAPGPGSKMDGKLEQGIPPTVVTSPGIATIPGQSKPALPENPVSVPAQATPQPVPVPATAAELAARAMVDNLKAVQSKYGMPGAKGKEDTSLVKKFQTAVSTTPDGKAGPATLVLAAGKGAVDLPLVMYWPTNATAATVAQYKASLSAIAQKLDSVGRGAEANTLRISIARENGQAGINGPKPVATAPKPVTTTATAPADPAPDWGLLKQGMKGTIIQHWQRVLVKGGFLPNAKSSTNGIWGSGTTAATKALQKKAGISQDGVCGPETRRAAVKLGIWVA